MKQAKNQRALAKACCLVALISAMTGCTQKDLYIPDGESQLPPKENYFDFNTKSDVTLRVNYGMPGYKALIEIYAENPIINNAETNTRTKRADLEALYKAYTDNNCYFSGTINIPTALEKVYIYTREMGLPECVEADVINGKIEFDGSTNSTSKQQAGTRSYGFNNSAPYLLNSSYQLYSICKWSDQGRLSQNVNYISDVTQIGVGDETISSLVTRLKKLLWKGQATKPSSGLDNSAYTATTEKTNIYISPKSTSGNQITGAHIDVVFIHERGDYRNTFGYYYYKGNSKTAETKKFIVFPNVSIAGDNPYATAKEAILKPGNKVRLQFFGEDGTAKAQDLFPADYTIGWFIVSDGYNPTSNEIQYLTRMKTTNDTKQQYITLYDEKSQKLIIGVEDGPDKSFEDLLFYVEADPMEAILNPENPGRPIIPDGGGAVIPPADETETVSGTLAFEDVWPSGGDYDMNDVVVEYKRQVTFDNNNKVKKIVDTFKPMHNGATFLNTFAYQIDPSQMGKVTLSEGVATEAVTNSIIVFANTNEEVTSGKSDVITREFDASRTFSKLDLKAYNPYIIVQYTPGKQNRTEVHLPKYQSTSLANLEWIYTTKHVYFIDKDGLYPFAIDIPVVNFKVTAESVRIDNKQEYPDFVTWAKSKGTTYKEWYKNYKGGGK